MKDERALAVHPTVKTKKLIPVLPAPEHVGQVERRSGDGGVGVIERLRNADVEANRNVLAFGRGAGDNLPLLRRAARARRNRALETQERDVALLPRAVLVECERNFIS